MSNLIQQSNVNSAVPIRPGVAQSNEIWRGTVERDALVGLTLARR
jgi:hypothetical protein